MEIFKRIQTERRKTKKAPLDLETQKQLALFSKLRKIVHLINTAPNLDALLLNLKDEILALLDAERITIYAVTEDEKEIYSKIKAGNEIQEFRVPIDNTSIAGYVANNQIIMSIQDAYNAKELTTVDSQLRFNREFDQRSGFRTKEVLAVPIGFGDKLVGVLQLINKKHGDKFADTDQRAAVEIAETVAFSFHNHQKTRGKHLSKFDLLLSENLLLPKDLDHATETSRKTSESLEKILMDKFKVHKQDIGRALSAFYRRPFFEFKTGMPVPFAFLDQFDPNYLRNQLWVPLRREEESVVIVIDNPRALDKMDDIRRHISARTYRYMVAVPDDILKTIDYFWGASIEEREAPDQDVAEILEELPEERQEDIEISEEVSESDHVVIRLVNRIISDAYHQGASDIHVEPYSGKNTQTVVRFRVDGSCKQYKLLPNQAKRALLSRIKIMADLDIANHRTPQDGKIQFRKYGGEDIELRVATLPTVGGNEDAVMRILASSEPIPIGKIGMSPSNLKRFKQMVTMPYGIVLVVGPTGSGKTTTLHSALSSINTVDRKIWTAEDPVEITQLGLRQVQINNKAGYTFANAMRAFLRADPDVIMVGEMRDHETAAIGIEASLTGHLVFSTLHTNSAPETIVRLLDMGIDPFNFADALIGVLAQRLVRTLCKQCREPYPVTDETLLKIAAEYGEEESLRAAINGEYPQSLQRAGGCNNCNGGYKGRMGIHELLTASDQIKLMVQNKVTAANIRNVALSEGMLTLKQDGILKVLAGHTDLHQVRSVCIK